MTHYIPPHPPVAHSKYKVHWVMDFLRAERVRQGLSQQTLAAKAEMFTSALGQYETGRCSLPGLRKIERVLLALGYKLTIQKIKQLEDLR